MVYVTVTPHQDRPDGSCSAVALANYLEVPYAEARALIEAETDFQPYRGTSLRSLNALLKSLGFEFVEARVRLTAKNPEAKLPRKAILLFSKHVAAYKDGTVYDTFDTLWRSGTKQTLGYWVEA